MDDGDVFLHDDDVILHGDDDDVILHAHGGGDDLQKIAISAKRLEMDVSMLCTHYIMLHHDTHVTTEASLYY